MQLIVITSDTTMHDEPDLVNQLFEKGLPRLHIRKPLSSIEDCRKYIEAIDPQYHSCIVLQDYFDLYDEYSLGGIHLNTTMRHDPLVWLKIKRLASVPISSSFHSWQEIESNKFPYDYVFISPVFNSISKPGYAAAIDLAGAAATREKMTAEHRSCPALIGLGGVGAEQISILRQYGFDGAAVLGGIWNAADPVSVFDEIMKATNA